MIALQFGKMSVTVPVVPDHRNHAPLCSDQRFCSILGHLFRMGGDRSGKNLIAVTRVFLTSCRRRRVHLIPVGIGHHTSQLDYAASQYVQLPTSHGLLSLSDQTPLWVIAHFVFEKERTDDIDGQTDLTWRWRSPRVCRTLRRVVPHGSVVVSGSGDPRPLMNNTGVQMRRNTHRHRKSPLKP